MEMDRKDNKMKFYFPAPATKALKTLDERQGGGGGRCQGEPHEMITRRARQESVTTAWAKDEMMKRKFNYTTDASLARPRSLSSVRLL